MSGRQIRIMLCKHAGTWASALELWPRSGYPSISSPWKKDNLGFPSQSVSGEPAAILIACRNSSSLKRSVYL